MDIKAGYLLLAIDYSPDCRCTSAIVSKRHSNVVYEEEVDKEL